MFSDVVYKWLENALDYGITEAQYWEMTLAELTRAIESKKRVNKAQEQKQAAFDYILADLIGQSVARVFSSENTLPDIAEVYPTLFNDEEITEQKQAKKDELSAARFRQFAQAHNSNFKEVSG